MDTRPLKALEIEALTYIYEPETSASPAERDRWWKESFRAHAIMAGVSLGRRPWRPGPGAVGLAVVLVALAALAWVLLPA